MLSTPDFRARVLAHFRMNDPNQTPHPREFNADFEVARKLHKKHGTSYYFATKLFPRTPRLSTHALYAFFRVPDEIVDNSEIANEADLERVKNELAAWRAQWKSAYESGKSDDAVLRVTAHVFHKYNIPYEYSQAFLDAMTQDLEKTRYATYAELESYMYGSAAVVGLMMSYVIGFEKDALKYAEKLGYAMQLTNFLRDIDEDYTQRQRVYFPQDELARFGVSTRDIEEKRFSENFKSFMEFQAQRARDLYRESDAGIPLLAPYGRFSVRVAGALYGAILEKIAQQNYNPFVGRARTNLREKLVLAARAYRTK
jgi:phytoene synthase